jgi:myo-inositol 2-dehydrogenase/D-chiro-inositol 1-dehydrogenase
MFRFALLGAGFIGKVHAASLASHPDVKLEFVFDIALDRAQELADLYGAKATTNIDEIFNKKNVDAILIATSTATHSEFLKRAADIGMPTYCEKPIDLSLETARETVEYCESKKLFAMVGFNRRFDRDHDEVHQAVASAEMGDIELVEMSARGPSMPAIDYLRTSGGIFRDSTIHFFDLTRWITAMDPVEVFATGSTMVDSQLKEFGDVDTAVVTLKLPNGGLVVLDNTRRAGYGYDEKIEVFGSKGMIESRRNRTGSVSRYLHGQVIESGLHAGWFERVQPTYFKALSAFVAALKAGVAPSPSLRDGLKAQALAEAATKSLASGKSETVIY